MGTKCTALILLLFSYERDLCSVSLLIPFDIIKALHNTSRYLDDILNMENPYFARMVPLIYPAELNLLQANTSDVEGFFSGPISNYL